MPSTTTHSQGRAGSPVAGVSASAGQGVVRGGSSCAGAGSGVRAGAGVAVGVGAGAAVGVGAGVGVGCRVLALVKAMVVPPAGRVTVSPFVSCGVPPLSCTVVR